MTSLMIFVFSVLVQVVFARMIDVREQTTVPSQCEDIIEVCDLLDPIYYCVGDYYSWAWENCKKTCNLCDGDAPTTVDPDTTTQRKSVCDYHGHQYNQDDNWTTNDRLNCTCLNASIGYYRCRDLPCLHPDCIGYGPESGFLLPHHEGYCLYKGQIYSQDQSWDDGCDQTCTCTHADSGSYSCRAVCLNWTNLPPICTLEDAPPGLCCQQLECPSNVTVTIPKAYKHQYPGYHDCELNQDLVCRLSRASGFRAVTCTDLGIE